MINCEKGMAGKKRQDILESADSIKKIMEWNGENKVAPGVPPFLLLVPPPVQLKKQPVKEKQPFFFYRKTPPAVEELGSDQRRVTESANVSNLTTTKKAGPESEKSHPFRDRMLATKENKEGKKNMETAAPLYSDFDRCSRDSLLFLEKETLLDDVQNAQKKKGFSAHPAHYRKNRDQAKVGLVLNATSGPLSGPFSALLKRGWKKTGFALHSNSTALDIRKAATAEQRNGGTACTARLCFSFGGRKAEKRDQCKNGLLMGSEKAKTATIDIQSTHNNTIYTLTSGPKNRVRTFTSAGSCGFKNTRKATSYASQAAAEKMASRVKEYKIAELDCRMRGLGAGKLSGVRTLHQSGLRFKRIWECTPLPHNGCRPGKSRRV